MACIQMNSPLVVCRHSSIANVLTQAMHSSYNNRIENKAFKRAVFVLLLIKFDRVGSIPGNETLICLFLQKKIGLPTMRNRRCVKLSFSISLLNCLSLFLCLSFCLCFALYLAFPWILLFFVFVCIFIFLFLSLSLPFSLLLLSSLSFSFSFSLAFPLCWMLLLSVEFSFS